ncbi:MAG: AraC family transcriptional regulator [Pseudomonadota bacterium]
MRRRGKLSMMAEIEILEISRVLTAAMAVFCIVFVLRFAPRTPVATYFALFAAAMLCAALANLFGDALGPLAPVIALGGFAGCGWAWLFSRSLFQPKPDYEIWPLAIVGLILAPEIVKQALLAGGVVAAPLEGPVWRIAGNLQSLASSAVLILAPIEALRGYAPSLPTREKRFRLLFVAGYASLVAVAVLWVRQSADGSLAAQLEESVQAAGAFAALAAATLAARFRFAFPVPAAQTKPRAPRGGEPADPEMDALAVKVARLFEEREIFATANLKVADIAEMLDEPDYKVSRCITGAMGFSNFNRLVNHHRVERAKRMLADPTHRDQSILSIGLDCGFGSIGPFNRAFKEATGETPRAYRAGPRQGETAARLTEQAEAKRAGADQGWLNA